MAERVERADFGQHHHLVAADPGAAHQFVNAAIAACVAALRASDGRIGVDHLACIGNLSTRQLERRFLHEVGIPPRLLANILRFRRVFDLFDEPLANSWVEAALSAGYFDQAHMIRDFKEFAHTSPSFLEKDLEKTPLRLQGTSLV